MIDEKRHFHQASKASLVLDVVLAPDEDRTIGNQKGNFVPTVVADPSQLFLAVTPALLLRLGSTPSDRYQHQHELRKDRTLVPVVVDAGNGLDDYACVTTSSGDPRLSSVPFGHAAAFDCFYRQFFGNRSSRRRTNGIVPIEIQRQWISRFAVA